MEKLLVYVCSECGEEYSRWQGKCNICSNWNTLKEFKFNKKINKKENYNNQSKVLKLAEIETSNSLRISTGISEFDRVLGGSSNNHGIVPGSLILLGGDPGIGKSTILLQTASMVKNTLYITGEESAEQIKIRYDRLGLMSSDLQIYAQTDLEQIINQIQTLKPKFAIIDSIQTIYSNDFPSTPGSLVQVKECALKILQTCKSTSTAVVLVGHITKDGTIAGPKTLEHLVDVVLYLEGDRYQNIRVLRGMKNRFGATDEIGIFEMTESGFKEVNNPSELFLQERLNHAPGSVVTAMMEGTRPLLIEVQALTNKAIFGYPQRRAVGFDLNRLQILIAVLQKHTGINLSELDVFVNIVGGIKANEPAIDLAVLMAISSAVKNKPIEDGYCINGEVGLSGEIRKVSFAEKRIKESDRLGYKKQIKSKNIKDAISEVSGK